MSSPQRAGSAPGISRPETAPESSVAVLTLPGLVETRQTQPPLNKHHLFPHELFVSLTSTVSNKTTAGHTIHNQHCEACAIRRPDAVWHHRVGRQKYKYFLDQPTSLTGAGRDISFLCDALVPPKKTTTLPPLTEKGGVTDTQKLSVSESLIPDEYRMVKNEGIRTLELYEDAFTVQLKDQQQKLRVLPSMNPSGRLEVLQLLRLMDDMLEKAGVDQETEELTELCQLEGLLHLVQVEQNIYNIVFHEVIRQVSVSCAERGQLLAKLRQRYQSLLDRIPRRLKSLHTELVAQRSLNRRFTEEIHEIKTCLDQLNIELSRIRENDASVLQQAALAQKQLADSLKQTDTNLHVVQGYHELYELQRARLETQLLQITEDRDYWSQFTLCLAVQVISIKKLNLFNRLHVDEQAWSKRAESCILLLISEDLEDLQIITEFLDYWGNNLTDLMSNMKKHDLAVRAQIDTIQQDADKWLSLNATQKELAREKSPGTSTSLLEDIHSNLLKWSMAWDLLCEHYMGEKQLWCQQTLYKFANVQEKWVTFSFLLFKRHCSPDGDLPEGHQALKELDSILSEHLQQIDKRLSGEDGIHEKISTMNRIIKAWIFRVSEAIAKVQKSLQWSNLEKALRECQRLSEEILQYLSFSKNNSDKNSPDIHSETEKLLDKVQEFKTSLYPFTEDKTQKLREQVNFIQKGQTRWMLELLLLVIADNNKELTQKEGPSCFEHITVQTVHANAKTLREKLDRLTGYIVSLCMLSLEKRDTLSYQKDEYDTMQYESSHLQADRCKWEETCEILLSGLNIASVELFLQQTEAPPGTDDLVDPADNTVAPVEEVVVAEQSELETEAEGTKDETEAETEPEPAGEHESPKQQGAPSSCDSLVVKQIGYDTHIREKKLEESSVNLTGVDEQFVSPVTEYAQKAFSDLATIAFLQQELHDSEVRVISAEQRALKAEEALHAALDKIQDMESQSSLESESREEKPPSRPRSPNEPKPSAGRRKSKKR